MGRVYVIGGVCGVGFEREGGGERVLGVIWRGLCFGRQRIRLSRGARSRMGVVGGVLRAWLLYGVGVVGCAP